MSRKRDNLLRKHADAGKLERHIPTSVRPAKRCAYLTESAVSELSDSSAAALIGGRGAILAALDHWVLGGRIHGELQGQFLKPLGEPPPDVWEIKVRSPTIQSRIIVRFAAPDVLVVTHCRTRGELDRAGAFDDVMRDCVAEWDALFHGESPFSGNSIHEYVTENCDNFPHKGRRPSDTKRKKGSRRV